jgi:hypothetical protein
VVLKHQAMSRGYTVTDPTSGLSNPQDLELQCQFESLVKLPTMGFPVVSDVPEHCSEARTDSFTLGGLLFNIS